MKIIIPNVLVIKAYKQSYISKRDNQERTLCRLVTFDPDAFKKTREIAVEETFFDLNKMDNEKEFKMNREYTFVGKNEEYDSGESSTITGFEENKTEKV